MISTTLLRNQRLNARGVDHQRSWTHEGRDYLGHGRPTGVVGGPTIGWMLDGMDRMWLFRTPFFVLCGSHDGQKSVCVVNYNVCDGNSVPLTCLTTRANLNARYENIWEMIHDAPPLPLFYRNQIPITYQTAAEIRQQRIVVLTEQANVEITAESFGPELVAFQRPYLTISRTVEEITDRRSRRASAMRTRLLLEGFLAAPVLPLDYLLQLATQSAFRRTVQNITDRCPFAYAETVRNQREPQGYHPPQVGLMGFIERSRNEARFLETIQLLDQSVPGAVCVETMALRAIICDQEYFEAVHRRIYERAEQRDLHRPLLANFHPNPSPNPSQEWGRITSWELRRDRYIEVDRIGNLTETIANDRTTAERAAVDEIQAPREPVYADRNYAIMLANLAYLHHGLDWIERYVDRVEAQEQEALEEAARLQARCIFCRLEQNQTDEYAVRLEFDSKSGETIIEECCVCRYTRDKVSYRCCRYRQATCLPCALKFKFARPRQPHDANAPPLPPIQPTQPAPPKFEMFW
jgi:hypothetical protein